MAYTDRRSHPWGSTEVYPWPNHGLVSINTVSAVTGLQTAKKLQCHAHCSFLLFSPRRGLMLSNRVFGGFVKVKWHFFFHAWTTGQTDYRNKGCLFLREKESIWESSWVFTLQVVVLGIAVSIGGFLNLMELRFGGFNKLFLRWFCGICGGRETHHDSKVV